MSEPSLTPLSLPARVLRATGFGLWLLAAVAAAWELLALQPPASPLHLGVLAGPIAQLCGFAFALGTAALVTSLAWSSLHAEGEGLFAALLLSVGALVHVAALAYAASAGILAVQFLDPPTRRAHDPTSARVGHAPSRDRMLAVLRRGAPLALRTASVVSEPQHHQHHQRRGHPQHPRQSSRAALLLAKRSR